MPILECVGLERYFGSLKAISDLSFSVEKGEIFAVVGPNGSGKTTLFNLITKVLPPTAGTINFMGRRIDGLKSHQISHLGIARTFQVPAFFPTMNVWQQLSVAAISGERGGDVDKNIFQALEFVGLTDKAGTPTHLLNIYDKKRLMIATAMATQPKLLLLDEPIGGLAGTEVPATLTLIRKIRESGITPIVIEHNMKAVMELSDRVMVLHHGEKIAEGPPAQVTKDQQVISVYLGRAM